jgi:hypothetical protein
MAVDEGVLPERKQDESLLAYLRRLSVAERLALNDASVRLALKLRDGFRRLDERDESRHR